MTPYYEEKGIVIYLGDSHSIVSVPHWDQMKYFLMFRHLILPLCAIEVFFGFHPWMVVLSTFTGLALWIDIWTRSKNPGAIIILAGAVMNRVVVFANGCYMPVGDNLIKATTGRHTPLTASSHLSFLADIHNGSSKGDFVILAGIVIVLGIWAGRKLRIWLAQ